MCVRVCVRTYTYTTAATLVFEMSTIFGGKNESEEQPSRQQQYTLRISF